MQLLPPQTHSWLLEWFRSPCLQIHSKPMGEQPPQVKPRFGRDQHARFVCVHSRNEQMKHATPPLVSFYLL